MIRGIRRVLLGIALTMALGSLSAWAQAPPLLRVGHVGHDHHTALYVAADNSDRLEKTTGYRLKKVDDRKRYELYDGAKKIADVETIKVGGGSKMPTALAQGVIDMGLGGVAAVVAAWDKGAPVKMIAPLHYKGDMFVVRPDSPVKTWQDFVALAKKSDKPLRIGYKSPRAVAKIVFEEALAHEGIPFGGDPTDPKAKVIMVNVKGGGKLNVALSEGLVDGYAGNNPFPAIAVDRGIARVVADLETLPPGTFRNHPCCCVAANTKALEEKPEAIRGMLALLAGATDIINSDLDTAASAASRWIGTSEAVEKSSIPTSGYEIAPTADWHKRMAQWCDAMNRLGAFTGKLKGLDESQVAKQAYDFRLLEQARQRIASR